QGIGAVEREDRVGGAELAVPGGNSVVGDGDAADRNGDGDGEERQQQELLPPLAAEQAPRPPNDRAPGRDSAGSLPAQGVRPGGGVHRRSPAASSDSGPGGAVVWSTTRPSRRKTTRSAHDARCASWVTTTPATPRCVAARSRRMTASPFIESSAPVGSSASSRPRPPTIARAIATRCRW